MYVPQNTIEKYLLEQKINPANNGFIFLTCVLSAVFETDCAPDWSITNCYKDVGVKHRTTGAAVERSIRYAIRHANINLTIKEFCVQAYYHFKHRQ